MSALSSRKPGWRLLLIIACTVFIAAVIGLLVALLPRWLAPAVTVPSVYVSTDLQGEEILPTNPIDFATLQTQKPEAVAWIQIDGTVINYPIMQSGNNRAENFYLDHASDGTAHRAGSIYMQKINDPHFTNPNTVLYGHNMANGSMFAAIRYYQRKDFFDKHPTITVYIPGHILTYEVYSAFVYDNRHILNSFNFFNQNDYATFLQQTLHPASMIKQVRENISVTTNARILTLSTCTGRSSERFLVIGVLTNDQRTK